MSQWVIALGAVLAAAPMCMAADGPTYTKDIAPIVFENCATCHPARVKHFEAPGMGIY